MEFSAFTIERYFAVCRPLLNSSLSTIQRAIKIQIFIWFIAILSSTPYFYFTKNIDHQCSFDRNFQLFVTICFHISAAFFFVIPAFILCFLYALMARRLYSVSLLHEVHWSKRQGINSNCSPIDLQHIAVADHRLEQQFRTARHLSSPTLMLAQQSIFRNETNSSPSLSLNIQAMKKSAFKMLCKFSLSYKRKISHSSYFYGSFT